MVTGRRRWSIVLAACLAVGVAILARPGAGDSEQHLLDALLSGDRARVQHLLERGAPADARVANGEHRDKTALMLVAQRGDVVLVNMLLDSGADVDGANDRGGNALMFAATQGHAEVVERLLEGGATVDAQADNGWTALMLATAKDEQAIVKRLAVAGANVDLADVYGFTPLMRAAEQGNAKMMDLLGSLGADPDRRNDEGATAADIASLMHSGSRGSPER